MIEQPLMGVAMQHIPDSTALEIYKDKSYWWRCPGAGAAVPVQLQLPVPVQVTGVVPRHGSWHFRQTRDLRCT